MKRLQITVIVFYFDFFGFSWWWIGISRFGCVRNCRWFRKAKSQIDNAQKLRCNNQWKGNSKSDSLPDATSSRKFKLCTRTRAGSSMRIVQGYAARSSWPSDWTLHRRKQHADGLLRQQHHPFQRPDGLSANTRGGNGYSDPETGSLKEIFYWNMRKFAIYPLSIYNKFIQTILISWCRSLLSITFRHSSSCASRIWQPTPNGWCIFLPLSALRCTFYPIHSGDSACGFIRVPETDVRKEKMDRQVCFSWKKDKLLLTTQIRHGSDD